MTPVCFMCENQNIINGFNGTFTIYCNTFLQQADLINQQAELLSAKQHRGEIRHWKKKKHKTQMLISMFALCAADP